MAKKKARTVQNFFEQPETDQTFDPDGFVDAHREPGAAEKTEKNVQISFQVTAAFRKQMKLLAIEKNKSISQLIRDLLAEEMMDAGLI